MRKEAMAVTRVVADDALFAALRQVRKEIAAEEQVPPFVIVSDETLRDLCTKLPQTREALLGVKGIGATKQERYGARFFYRLSRTIWEAIRPTLRPWRYRSSQKRRRRNSHRIWRHMRCISRGKSMQEIADERQLSRITIENHIVQCLEEGLTVAWENILTPEQEGLIQEAASRVGPEKAKAH
ncbi:hypothetical protein GCM10020331_061330 [Ectobacillus funiculus]